MWAGSLECMGNHAAKPQLTPPWDICASRQRGSGGSSHFLFYLHPLLRRSRLSEADPSPALWAAPFSKGARFMWVESHLNVWAIMRRSRCRSRSRSRPRPFLYSPFFPIIPGAAMARMTMMMPMAWSQSKRTLKRKREAMTDTAGSTVAVTEAWDSLR